MRYAILATLLLLTSYVSAQPKANNPNKLYLTGPVAREMQWCTEDCWRTFPRLTLGEYKDVEVSLSEDKGLYFYQVTRAGGTVNDAGPVTVVSQNPFVVEFTDKVSKTKLTIKDKP